MVSSRHRTYAEKNRQSYEYMFQILKDEVYNKFQLDLSHRFISTDYEVAVMNVVRNKFPEISRCLFHLAQSFWRRLQSEGLAEAYRQEENEDF